MRRKSRWGMDKVRASWQSGVAQTTTDRGGSRVRTRLAGPATRAAHHAARRCLEAYHPAVPRSTRPQPDRARPAPLPRAAAEGAADAPGGGAEGARGAGALVAAAAAGGGRGAAAGAARPDQPAGDQEADQ